MRFLIRLAAVLILIVFGAHCVLDNPINYFGKTVGRMRCAIDKSRPCPVTALRTPPGVAVLFVDKGLATRQGRRVAILAEDWPYCYDPPGDVYEAPQFFETDFASIPSFAQFYIEPSDPQVIGAAIIHDWLYALGGEPPEEARRFADDVFRFELKQGGVNVVKRNIMYFAVSFFGGGAFGEDPAAGHAGHRQSWTGLRRLCREALEPGCAARARPLPRSALH